MRRDGGIILVNVLVALALGAALVVLMFTSQDNLVDRSRRMAAASQAEALALGGEASILAALSRDMIAAPDTDNRTEDWARIEQDTVALDSGRFSVSVSDAQARFDINQLQGTPFAATQILSALIAQAGLPARIGQAIVAQVQREGPLPDLDALRDMDAATRDTLETLLVALPVPGEVNLNTAPLPVIAAVLGNAASAARLVSLRDRKGFVTPDDLTAVGAVALPGVGFTSDVFDVTVMAEVDDVTIALHSRVLRLHRTATEREVRVIARRWGTADIAAAAE